MANRIYETPPIPSRVIKGLLEVATKLSQSNDTYGLEDVLTAKAYIDELELSYLALRKDYNTAIRKLKELSGC